MKIQVLIVCVLLICQTAFSQSTKVQEERKNIALELTRATDEIEKAFIEKNEEALLTPNLDKKLEPIQDKMTAFKKKYPELQKPFEVEVNRVNALIDKINAQKEKIRPSEAEVLGALKNAEKSIENLEKKKSVISERLSYDEWFTLHNTGIKSGKKYSFIGCVIGPRNATAVRCHVPGTAAKRVFYNLDDIQSQEMRVKWLNTNNKDMCVTAYVTGGEAFVVSIAEPSSCK